jgi:hypothetical protein
VDTQVESADLLDLEILRKQHFGLVETFVLAFVETNLAELDNVTWILEQVVPTLLSQIQADDLHML